MRPFPPSLIIVVLAWVIWANTAKAEIVCDPKDAHLFLSAGQIQDHRLQVGSRSFDSGANAPKVVLECVAKDGTTKDEKACGEDVQKLFVTWHAAGGLVEAQCMPGTVKGKVDNDSGDSGDKEADKKTSSEAGPK